MKVIGSRLNVTGAKIVQNLYSRRVSKCTHSRVVECDFVMICCLKLNVVVVVSVNVSVECRSVVRRLFQSLQYMPYKLLCNEK